MDTFGQSYQNLLIESQIFPPIQVIAGFIKSKNILIEAQEHYQKRSFRNRYYIGSHQGRLALSVPLVKGKNNHQSITEVKISYQSAWPAIHWKALQSTYGKSAFFIYYKDLVKEVLFSDCSYLFELNNQSLSLVKQILQPAWEIQFTKQYQPSPSAEILDVRNKFNLKNIESFSIPEYYQVFSSSTGFITQLSVLDCIFHLGPEALSYLMSFHFLLLPENN